MDMNMPHDDAAQDETQMVDMISKVLHKVADEMLSMEADRHLPDGHPLKKVEMKAEVSPMHDDSAMDGQSEPDSDDMDPSMLSSLMDKAGSADSDGSLPEDKMDDEHPAIAALIAQKKKQA